MQIIRAGAEIAVCSHIVRADDEQDDIRIILLDLVAVFQLIIETAGILRLSPAGNLLDLEAAVSGVIAVILYILSVIIEGCVHVFFRSDHVKGNVLLLQRIIKIFPVAAGFAVAVRDGITDRHNPDLFGCRCRFRRLADAG